MGDVKRTVLTKFAADLDASYKSALKDLQDCNRVLNSEMKLLNAQYKDNKDSVEYLTQSLDIQTRKMYGQKEVVEELEKTYAEMARKEGANHEAVMKLQAKLNDERARLLNMEHDIAETAERLTESATGLSKWAAEVDASYNTAQKSFKATNDVFNSELRKLDAQYRDSSKSVEYLTQKLEVQTKAAQEQGEYVSKLRKIYQEVSEKMGESSEEAKKWAAVLNNAEADLLSMENGIEDTVDGLDEASLSASKSAKIFSLFTGEAKGLGDVADVLSNKLGLNLPSGITKSLNGLGKLNPAVVAGAGAFVAMVAAIKNAEDQLKEMALESATFADNILTMSNNTSISTTTLQEWSYAAELIDVSVDTVTGSMEKMIRNMDNARGGTGDAAEAFETLGVSITNADGTLRSAEDVFFDSIDALGKIENATERDAISMNIFGKSAQDLNSLIVQGSATLREYADEAHNTGYVMSTEQLEALGAVDDAQQRLLQTQEAVTNQISAEYAPYMEQALTMTRDMTQEVGEALTDSRVVESLGSILTSATGLLQPLAQLGTEILPVLDFGLSTVAGTLAWIADAADVVYGLLTLDFGRIGTALGFNSSQASNMQKWMYGADYKTDSYGSSFGWARDEETGLYSGNYFNASGTDNFPGGVSWVGENGPEKVLLPAGTQILSAQESREEAGNVYIDQIVIDARSVKEFNDIIEIIKNQRRVSRMKGANA